jgi:Fur family peroxide stress response transcriptional regulator
MITINSRKEKRMQKTRYSKQRELIYDNIKNRLDHPTAEDVYASLKQEYPTLSLGTVYRNLNFLADSKLVRKLHVGKQSIHFDACLEGHHHFVCQKCHQIYDIQNIEIDAIISNALQKHTPHKIMDTYLILTGVCEACQKEKN